MTNYEKIKNMNIKELASELEKLSNYVCHDYKCSECPFCRLWNCKPWDCYDVSGLTEWLNSEVEE